MNLADEFERKMKAWEQHEDGALYNPEAIVEFHLFAQDNRNVILAALRKYEAR